MSRTGRPDCKPGELFDFITDIRNFKQFIGDGNVNDLIIEKELCSFRVSQLGNVSLKISGKEPFKKVVYSGKALNSNDFSLLVDIKETVSGYAEVTVALDAEMNPLMKMIASNPVKQFLEKLIDEMEKFRGWKDIMA